MIGLIKDELDEKVMTKFVGLGAKTYSYVIDHCSKDRKAKGTQRGVIKKLKSTNYKNRLESTHLENKINHLEKTQYDVNSLTKDHKEFIETIN